MIVVGLTGGIGSGKSTIAKVFSILGIPVFDSDLEAKKCYQESSVKLSLINYFGDSIIKNNEVNFNHLSELVFSNPNHLKWLNELIHPLVKIKFDAWKKLQSSAYVIKEAAILFESGANLSCDKIITVVSDETQRINRVIKRDNVSREKVLARIRTQMSDEQKIAQSNFVIHNDFEMIVPQVLAIHQQLISSII